MAQRLRWQQQRPWIDVQEHPQPADMYYCKTFCPMMSLGLANCDSTQLRFLHHLYAERDVLIIALKMVRVCRIFLQASKSENLLP